MLKIYSLDLITGHLLVHDLSLAEVLLIKNVLSLLHNLILLQLFLLEERIK
jgi:hypothetical protein